MARRMWSVDLTDEERIWLRSMMFAHHQGFAVSGDDRMRCREFEARLAPKRLERERSEKESDAR